MSIIFRPLSHSVRVDIPCCGPSYVDFGFVCVCASFHSDFAQTIGRAACCRPGWREPNAGDLPHASSENNNRCRGNKSQMVTIWSLFGLYDIVSCFQLARMLSFYSGQMSGFRVVDGRIPVSPPFDGDFCALKRHGAVFLICMHGGKAAS